jgi:hypothetical protein
MSQRELTPVIPLFLVIMGVLDCVHKDQYSFTLKLFILLTQIKTMSPQKFTLPCVIFLS